MATNHKPKPAYNRIMERVSVNYWVYKVYFPKCYIMRGRFLLQHLLLGVKFVLAHVIPDVPQWVQDEMARQQYKAQLALRVR